MSLLHLLESLEINGSAPDVESLFECVRQRVDHAAVKSREHLKMKEPPKAEDDWLIKSGNSVRTLDLSNCKWLPIHVSDIILHCRSVTHLDLVNTRLWDEDIMSMLNCLPNLVSLSFSLTSLLSTRPMVLRYLSPVKKLYIEARPDRSSLRTVIDLMNMLQNLENVHVVLVGSASFATYERFPYLQSICWQKLRTFVCSCHLSEDKFSNVPVFLKSIFATKRSSFIVGWIEKPKDCFIYDNGYVNTDDMDVDCSIVHSDKLQLLEKFQVFDLTESTSHGKKIRSPWGWPESLRIKAFKIGLDQVDLSQLFTTMLVELDITACHGEFSGRFWGNLAKSSPHLATLAVPLCLFLIEKKDWVDLLTAGPAALTLWKDDPAKEVEIFEESLLNLRLRKLFLKGNPESCESNECQRCSTMLTATNLTRLDNLQRLDELTFNNVNVDSGALKNVANSNVHTLRLRVNEMIGVRDMEEFVEACRNLRNFKFSGFNLPLHSMKICRALAAGEKLKRLCLGTRSPVSMEPSELSKLLSHVPPTVELLHFHIPEFEEAPSLRSILQDWQKDRGRSDFHCEAELLCDETETIDGTLRTSNLSEPFLGRGLCHAESFAGFVKPVRWEAPEN